MAAPNAALTQLLAALNARSRTPAWVQPSAFRFFAHVGSHMALARCIPAEWFPKSGTATEAQAGGLIANLHSLTTVAWAAFEESKSATHRFSGEPSTYDLHAARARQERELRVQVRKRGDEAMRAEPKVAVGGSDRKRSARETAMARMAEGQKRKPIAQNDHHQEEKKSRRR
jgi:hypothetical protein